jgi:hypothetical protein
MSARAQPLAFVLAIVGVAYVALAIANPMPSAVHGDGYYTYLWARTIVFDGDLSFHEDYRICPDPWGLANAPVADDVNYWNMGPALFWIPPLAWDRLVGHPALEAGTPHERAACLGPVPERAVMGSMVAGLLTVLLGFFGARRLAGPWPAAFAAIAGGLLTSLPYYATTMLSYGHAASSFGCGLFFVVWDRWRRDPLRPRGWLAMGAALGLAMLMRSQNAILVVLPLTTWCLGAATIARTTDKSAADPADSGNKSRARALGRHVLAGVSFVLCLLAVFSPQMIYLQLATGQPFDVSQGEHYMRWDSPRIASALFSTGAGLFTWSPIMYPALFGWIVLLAKRSTRALGVALLVVFALDTYVVASVYDWWASVGFPGRRFDMLIVPSIYGLAALGAAFRRVSWRNRGFGLAFAGGLLVVVLFAWNAALVAGIAKAVRIDQARPAPMHWGAIFHELSHPPWRSVGNPLAWPASIPFALEHDTHPRAWDVVGAQELFYHDHQTLERREHESTLELGVDWTEGYTAGTFQREPTRLHGRDVRVAGAGRARVLLPLHWPDLGAITIDASPLHEDDPPTVRCFLNGASCGQDVLDAARKTLRFEVPRGVSFHGINELVLELDEPAAFGRLQLLDPSPPPSVEQRRRNDELLERRRRATGRSP